MTQNLLPSPDLILSHPGTSHWLRNALQSALDRDPVDALNDAEVLVALLTRRVDDALAAAKAAINRSGT